MQQASDLRKEQREAFRSMPSPQSSTLPTAANTSGVLQLWQQEGAAGALRDPESSHLSSQQLTSMVPKARSIGAKSLCHQSWMLDGKKRQVF